MKIKDASQGMPLCRHHEICDDLQQILITSEQISSSVQVLTPQIQDAYSNDNAVVVPFLLEGARPFATDLKESLDNTKFNFVPLQVSSYGGSTRSTGQITMNSGNMPNIIGQSVLIVDDIYDSGLTLKQVKAHFEASGAASVRTCVMFEKDCLHIHEMALDFVGLCVPDEFVVGYGLDYQEQYRDLHCVGTLKPDILGAENHHGNA